jgi:hypothetical protein
MKSRVELVFHAFAVFLSEFAFLAVVDLAGELVTGFLPVELGVDTAFPGGGPGGLEPADQDRVVRVADQNAPAGLGRVGAADLPHGVQIHRRRP